MMAAMSRRRLVALITLPAVAATVTALALVGGRPAGRWVMDRIVALRFPDVETQDPARVAARLEGAPPPRLFDVRRADEYAASHLPGARHLPPDAEPAAALADVPRDAPIVLYCSVGWRSAAMARRMAAAGFTRVVNLEGSIFRWVAEGRPLVDAAGAPTARVHPFGPPWRWLVAPAHRAPDRAPAEEGG